ncbi:hypothetical protein L1987_23422 [Smallanthus sonchifolius]|uniref:Uncharacterized protein n=1 Tax=Smallanthus sonchifolius TaxID=185202 RepID=A0ACB9IK82_9ASTR|nr:hypothetical protein L1987_23422 [Smallanthus sonchifolius]
MDGDRRMIFNGGASQVPLKPRRQVVEDAPPRFNGRSFRDVLAKDTPLSREDKVILIPGDINACSDLYRRALVGRSADFTSFRSLNYSLRDVGFAYLDIHYIGGISVLLSFGSAEDAKVVEDESSFGDSTIRKNANKLDGTLRSHSLDPGPTVQDLSFFLHAKVRPRKRPRKDDPFDLDSLLGIDHAQEISPNQEQFQLINADPVLPSATLDLNAFPPTVI